jgi:hypothetical protein
VDAEFGVDVLEVAIAPECGVSFSEDVRGVDKGSIGDPAFSGFAYNRDGSPAGMRPHDSMTWAVEVDGSPKSRVRLDVACHGPDGEKWDVVIEAPVIPSPMEYLR